jgi:hypothetical protein
VIAFCWLDSTVRMAELPLELEAFAAVVVELEWELLPQAASSAAVPSTAHVASRRRGLIKGLIEEHLSL